jgi:hypothetical protein
MLRAKAEDSNSRSPRPLPYHVFLRKYRVDLGFFALPRQITHRESSVRFQDVRPIGRNPDSQTSNLPILNNLAHRSHIIEAAIPNFRVADDPGTT